MFITALIFIPIVNITLKIIKGVHLDLDLTESTSPKKLTPIKFVKTTKPLTPVKGSKKPVPAHLATSVKDSTLLPQMTNSKTTAQKPVPKTPMKPAI